jgi:arylsulfatase A-like enzyme
MVIRFPAARYAGMRVSQPLGLIDLVPTILDYIGRNDLSSDLQGRSLLPLVRGRSHAPEAPFDIPGMRINRKKYYRAFKETRGDINTVVRRGSLKAIFNAELDSLELYDLSKDPAEQNDLSSSLAAQARAMKGCAKARLDSCFSGGVNTDAGGMDGLDEETLQRLRALGYVD